MKTKAFRAKAARMTAGEMAKAFADAIKDAQVDNPATLPASTATLACVIELCGGDKEEVCSIQDSVEDQDGAEDGTDGAP